MQPMQLRMQQLHRLSLMLQLRTHHRPLLRQPVWWQRLQRLHRPQSQQSRQPIHVRGVACFNSVQYIILFVRVMLL
eukprot:SAG25_NODE_160_length_13390_cov_9.002708_19_plen_76_part_00